MHENQDDRRLRSLVGVLKGTIGGSVIQAERSQVWSWEPSPSLTSALELELSAQAPARDKVASCSSILLVQPSRLPERLDVPVPFTCRWNFFCLGRFGSCSSAHFLLFTTISKILEFTGLMPSGGSE